MTNLDIAKTVAKEEAVLEKFDGEPEDGILVERITLLNGVITKHEFFKDGEVVDVTEGGNYNSTDNSI
jgi:hypothetical protein